MGEGWRGGGGGRIQDASAALPRLYSNSVYLAAIFNLGFAAETLMFLIHIFSSIVCSFHHCAGLFVSVAAHL